MKKAANALAYVALGFLVVTVGLLLANPVHAEKPGVTIPACQTAGAMTYPCVIQGDEIVLMLSDNSWVVI